MSFIVFDTEDNSKELLESGQSGFDKRVTQIAAITREGKKYYSAGNIKDFKRWVRQQPERYLYAHNVQYDLGNLFGSVLDELDCTLLGGRMIKAVWGSKLFLDSFNIYVMSVKMLGKAFGLEKIETESMSTDKEYVFRDCEIVRAGLCYAWDFIESLGIKVLPSTAGGICFSVWKNSLGGSNCHDSLELSREAYYGGRVELFKQVNDCPWIAYTDINSLYPYALLGEYPGVLEDWGKELAPWGIARVDIDMPETDIAVLPFRQNDGRIVYPWGRFTGTWAMPEIQEAIRSGGKVLKVHQCYGTKETMVPYKEAMEKFYAARLMATSGAQKEFFKRMMNAFYGRLGSTGVISRTVYRNERNEKEGVPYGERVLLDYAMPLAEETNWSHAAYVTCYGRLHLLAHMRKIGADKLIYTDTDSTIFDVPHVSLNLQFCEQPKPSFTSCNPGCLPFPVGTELGQMKLESWEDIAQTWAPKMYRAGKKWKAKGVPVRLAKEFIGAGATGKPVHYDLPFKFREAIRFYDRGNTKRLSVWRQIEKFNRANYDRKILRGNRYYPCKVNALLSS